MKNILKFCFCHTVGYPYVVKSSNMGISGTSEVHRLISMGMLSTGDNYVVWINDFLKSSSNPWAQISFMPVRRKLVNVVLLSENHQPFAKITKKRLFWSYELIFWFFKRKKIPDFWWEIQNWSWFWNRTAAMKMPAEGYYVILSQSRCTGFFIAPFVTTIEHRPL